MHINLSVLFHSELWKSAAHSVNTHRINRAIINEISLVQDSFLSCNDRKTFREIALPFHSIFKKDSDHIIKQLDYKYSH